MARNSKRASRARDKPTGKHMATQARRGRWRNGRQRDVTDSVAGQSWRFPMGSTPSGKTVSPQSAMRLTAVYACVRVLSESVAQLPLHLYRDAGQGSKERATQHPLYKILHDEPNHEMSAFTFRETMMTHLLLYGNAYAQIIRNGRGEVVELWPLMAPRMRVDRDSNTRELIYQYSICDDENRVIDTQDLSPRDVLHIPGLGFDGVIGYSPIGMAKNAIGLTMAAEDYGATFYANGASPSGVLEHPGVLKNPEKVRSDWEHAYSGGNTHRVAVLEEGMKYTQISVSPDEAQFLDTRKFQVDEIARIFRVPPHLIGDMDHATFSNIEQQSLEFVTYTLQPWLVRWEQAIQRSLLNEADKALYFARFNVDGLLRGDYQSRMNGYATARQNGWMSANDIRELENMDLISPDDGGDLYLVNGSMTKLADAGAFANSGGGDTT